MFLLRFPIPFESKYNHVTLKNDPKTAGLRGKKPYLDLTWCFPKIFPTIEKAHEEADASWLMAALGELHNSEPENATKR